MRQSSIDVALGRMQVWIDNDTTRDVTPTRIVYRDPRLAKPLIGDNLRTNPAQSERGYYLYLPAEPPCDGVPGKAESGTVEITYGGRTDTVPVTDPTDVVGRFLIARCQELALAAMADVRWSDEVPDDGTGVGAIGTLTLLVTPTGVPGHELVIDHISGSHLLNSSEGPAAWAPDLRIGSDDPPTEIELPVKPSRCDVARVPRGRRRDGVPGGVRARRRPRRDPGPDESRRHGQRARLREGVVRALNRSLRVLPPS